jgi:hypothetical protein
VEYIECDGCGKRIESHKGTGYKTIFVRISGNEGATHSCSDGCLHQAVKVAAERALLAALHPTQ